MRDTRRALIEELGAGLAFNARSAERLLGAIDADTSLRRQVETWVGLLLRRELAGVLLTELDRHLQRDGRLQAGSFAPSLGIALSWNLDTPADDAASLFSAALVGLEDEEQRRLQRSLDLVPEASRHLRRLTLILQENPAIDLVIDVSDALVDGRELTTTLISDAFVAVAESATRHQYLFEMIPKEKVIALAEERRRELCNERGDSSQSPLT